VVGGESKRIFQREKKKTMNTREKNHGKGVSLIRKTGGKCSGLGKLKKKGQGRRFGKKVWEKKKGGLQTVPTPIGKKMWGGPFRWTGKQEGKF